MPRRSSPPVYTFQRSRKREPPPAPEIETYTTVDDTESVEYENLRYTRYTFFVVFTMLVLLILTTCYTYMKGFPVRIRA